MRGNGKAASGGVPENDVACPLLIVIDAQAVRDHLQILDPPIERTPAHFCDKFRSVRHRRLVSHAVPINRGLTDPVVIPLSLPQLVTNIASHSGVVVSMAFNTAKHLQRAFHCQHILRRNIAVAFGTLHLVLGMAERNEVW